MGYKASKYLGSEAKKILQSFSDGNYEYKQYISKKTSKIVKNELLSYIAYNFDNENDNAEVFKKAMNLISLVAPEKPKNQSLILDIMINNPQFRTDMNELDLISNEDLCSIENIYSINSAYRDGKLHKANYNRLISPIINRNIQDKNLFELMKKELIDFGFECEANKMMVAKYTTHENMPEDMIDTVTTFIAEEKGISTPIESLKQELPLYFEVIAKSENMEEYFKTTGIYEILEEYEFENGDEYKNTTVLDNMGFNKIAISFRELCAMYEIPSMQNYRKPILKMIDAVAKNRVFQDNAYMFIPEFSTDKNIFKKLLPIIESNEETDVNIFMQQASKLLAYAKTNNNLAPQIYSKINMLIRSNDSNAMIDTFSKTPEFINNIDLSDENGQQIAYAIINDTKTTIQKDYEKALASSIMGSYIIDRKHARKRFNKNYSEDVCCLFDIVEESDAAENPVLYSKILAKQKFIAINNETTEKIDKKINSMINPKKGKIDVAIFSNYLLENVFENIIDYEDMTPPEKQAKIINNSLLVIEKMICATTLDTEEIKSIEDSLENFNRCGLEFDKEIYGRILGAMKTNNVFADFLKNDPMER